MATGAPPPGPKRKRDDERAKEPAKKRGRKPKGPPEPGEAPSPPSPTPSDQSGRKTHTKRRLLTPKEG